MHSYPAVRRAGAVFLAVVTLVALTPSTARAQGGLPVTGTLSDGGVVRSATLFVSNITLNETTGALEASGTLIGVVTTATGQTSRFVQEFVAVPLQVTGTCPILDLDIGAIHLDLLGLVIDLAPIHLDIVAQSGPGNLLGNLLCALVGLLD